jgi:glycosyltransferase involved in cell wall biosynthesis
MRIAFFVEIFYPEINGVLTATLDLARNLKKRGHHVLLLVPKAKACEEVREIDGIEVFKVPSVPTYMYPGLRFNNPRSRAVFKKLRGDAIEILHTTGPGTMGMAAAAYSRKSRAPLVQTFHTLLNEDTYLLYLVRLRCLLPLGRFIAWCIIGSAIRASELITAPARFTCAELKKHFPKKTIRHISNSVDFSLFESFPPWEEFRGRYPFFTGKTFVFVGRVGLEKSIDVLIRGFAAAAEKDADLRLVIVGDGPSRADMGKLAAEKGAADKIIFLGKIAHAELLASGILRYGRAFITASVTENQPMTVIEAMCCGLPLILAGAEGLKELAGEAALVFPAGDEEALGQCILKVASDERLRERLGTLSREQAERFDGDRVARQFEEEYAKLLEGKNYQVD